MTSEWDLAFLRVADSYKDRVMKDGMDWFSDLPDMPIVLECLNQAYLALIKKDEICPIEKLESKEKMDLWEEAKRLSPNKDKETVIKVCKAIHTIGTLTQK